MDSNESVQRGTHSTQQLMQHNFHSEKSVWVVRSLNVYSYSRVVIAPLAPVRVNEVTSRDISTSTALSIPHFDVEATRL